VMVYIYIFTINISLAAPPAALAYSPERRDSPIAIGNPPILQHHNTTSCGPAAMISPGTISPSITHRPHLHAFAPPLVLSDGAAAEVKAPAAPAAGAFPRASPRSLGAAALIIAAATALYALSNGLAMTSASASSADTANAAARVKWGAPGAAALAASARGVTARLAASAGLRGAPPLTDEASDAWSGRGVNAAEPSAADAALEASAADEIPSRAPREEIWRSLSLGDDPLSAPRPPWQEALRLATPRSGAEAAARAAWAERCITLEAAEAAVQASKEGTTAATLDGAVRSARLAPPLLERDALRAHGAEVDAAIEQFLMPYNFKYADHMEAIGWSGPWIEDHWIATFRRPVRSPLTAGDVARASVRAAPTSWNAPPHSLFHWLGGKPV
jgi:hypothetical protein